jgi:hypothetical protein
MVGLQPGQASWWGGCHVPGAPTAGSTAGGRLRVSPMVVPLVRIWFGGVACHVLRAATASSTALRILGLHSVLRCRYTCSVHLAAGPLFAMQMSCLLTPCASSLTPAVLCRTLFEGNMLCPAVYPAAAAAAGHPCRTRTCRCTARLAVFCGAVL